MCVLAPSASGSVPTARVTCAESAGKLAGGRFDHSTTFMVGIGASRYLYRFRSTRPQQLRGFSLGVPRFYSYLVWAPDCMDSGALARRMAVRPKHFITANKQIKQGILSELG